MGFPDYYPLNITLIPCSHATVFLFEGELMLANTCIHPNLFQIPSKAIAIQPIPPKQSLRLKAALHELPLRRGTKGMLIGKE